MNTKLNSGASSTRTRKMSLYDGLIAPTADRTSDPYPRNLAVRQTDCEGATFLLKHFLGKRGELEDVLQLTNTLPVDRKEVNHILNGVGLLAPRPLAGLDLSDKYVVWCVPVKVPWCSHYNVPKVTGSSCVVLPRCLQHSESVLWSQDRIAMPICSCVGLGSPGPVP